MVDNPHKAYKAKGHSPFMRLISGLAILVLALVNQIPLAPVLAKSPAALAPAATNTLHLHVISANDSSTYNITKGSQITKFKYLINLDNSGTTAQRSPADPNNPGCSPDYVPPAGQPGYPDSCNWVSIAGAVSASPIVTQGDETDFGAGINLPDGRYLVSVLADNYKIDGAHFTLPSATGDVTVQMQPYDLPDATIQAAVFEDMAPTNSAPDLPAERGLAGFVGHISDYIDEVTTNVYGDPLCGNGKCVSQCYVVDGGLDIGTVAPVDSYGRCPVDFTTAGDPLLSANITQTLEGTPISSLASPVIEGKLKIPNVGPNRYALSVVPPDGSGWIQTTTLEGNHDWDAWVMEGATGLDTEFAVAGEPFPATFFGYVLPGNTMAAGAGTIKGTALAVSAYVPPVGGITGELGLQGAKPKDKNPIKRLFVSLSDINNGDRTVYVGEFDCNVAAGCAPVNFSIPNVPDGDYFIGLWDEPQDYIFNEQNVSLRNGEVVDLGSLSMLGWWTTIEGHVFNDLNANGKMDPGEPGIPNFPIVMRTRENSIMDRGATAVTTDGNGYYWMENAYPITQWLVEEAYVDGFQTTGITYQADNQPTETTVLGQGVDVNVHPVIGLGGRLDWGVKAYDRGTNGGIVGTVSYDTTRNELDPAYAAIENWQPSIPGLKVDLYAPIPCGTNAGAPCDANGFYELAADGSYALGTHLNQYISENWERPSGCVARNVDGNPLVHGVDEQVLPLDPNAPCIEAPLMGLQFGPMSDGTNFGASVDGNYGFGDMCAAGVAVDANGDVVYGADGTPECSDGAAHTVQLPANKDYLVKVEIPNDSLGRPMYKVTKEEDINIATGDSFVPQALPPACVGALHTVDVAGFGTDGYPTIVGDGVTLPAGVTVPASTPVDNPNFVSIGGSIYEGQAKPLCDMKLVRVSDRRSIAPGFNLFTDVPLPTRFWGLIVDDLNFSSNPKSQGYGEKMGVPFAPIGIYDYTNRLLYTAESDYNGLWDVLLPSTNRISCPTPSGVCANLYRFVGNDPGVPGRWNANYTPQYRTIAAEFEAFPGLMIPADLAPTQVAVAVQIPNTQTLTPVSCDLAATTPQLFTISKPYMYTNSNAANRTFTLTGLGFGAAQGIGRVTLDNTPVAINSWTDRSISFTVATGLVAAGPHQLRITANNGQSTINGLTFHVIATTTGGTAYNPTVYEVGPGRTYPSIQSALEAAAGVAKALVVVYPAAPDPTNPRYNGRGAYYENIVIHSPVKLQGVGPGGVYPDNTPVQGSIIDGIAYGGDTDLATAWRTLVGSLTWDGNQDVSEGQVIYILAHSNQFTAAYTASIDGLDIRGGDQMGFPGNLNAIFGGFPGPIAAVNVETQGGAIFANAYARYLQITNNLIDSNGGSYGAIRIGTPNIPAPNSNQHNDNVRIAYNRILANGGTNLAGAIGLFNGSNGYEVDHNDLCGNFSAEYGGAISHFGRNNGTTEHPVNAIHDNRIYFNHSYDEGAGIMIAGELPVNAAANYGAPGGPQGSGPVNIYNNLLQANLAEDDGGGLRFLMAGNFPINVYNNIIVNNVSTHEGGGVALDDAPNVRFYNNTVMNNVTTATAITSDGSPAPAGLSTGANSVQLQATLPGGSPTFSNPLLFNNIFWDNRAGSRGINMVTGIGAAGDANPINDWDLGVVGGTGLLAPTNSILQQNAGNYPYTTSPTNSYADPAVAQQFNVPLTFTSWRTNVNFIGAIMVTAELPPTLMGNYHLSSTASPAFNLGAASKAVPAYQQAPATLSAPAFDVDNQARPALGGFDSGADEFPGAQADLSIVKTDGLTNVDQGGSVQYAINVGNAGPQTAALAQVVDTVPSALTGVTWTCAATSGSACSAASGSGSINTTITLVAGGTVTFTLNGTVSSTAAGTLVNTATVSAPVGVTDPVPGNNTSTDNDTINLPLPASTLLDNFNRANANTLGGNWSQVTVGGAAAIRVNNNQAFCINTGLLCTLPGQAIWNVPAGGFGAQQVAAFTFAAAPVNGTSLFLKASGGTANLPANFIRVRYSGGQVFVETTTTGGLTYTARGAFSMSFASGDTLTAAANANGNVFVWKTSGSVTTFVGGVTITGAGFWTGTGRIGIQLQNNARVDDFRGGTVTTLPATQVTFVPQSLFVNVFVPLVTNK